MGRSKRAIAVGVVVLGMAGISGVAWASGGSPSTIVGRQTTAVKVVRDTENQSTETLEWQDVPGATATISVAANSKALILVRFSAESSCTTHGGEENYCSLRVLINDVEAEPASGTDFAFVKSTPFTAPPVAEAHSMERSLGPLSSGTYAVRLQWITVIPTGGFNTFTLDDWSLTVERVRA
jgi:hypothetical protein